MHPHLVCFISKVNPFRSIDEYDHMEGLDVKGVMTLGNFNKSSNI